MRIRAREAAKVPSFPDPTLVTKKLMVGATLGP